MRTNWPEAVFIGAKPANSKPDDTLIPLYAHSSVAGMPDEQIHAIAVKWAQSNFRVGVLEIESAIKEAVRALGGA